MIGRDAAANSFGISNQTLRRYNSGKPSRKIESFISTHVGDDLDALRAAIRNLESPPSVNDDEEDQVSEQPSPEYMPLSFPQPDSSKGADTFQGSSWTLTVEPHPHERTLPPPLPALAAEWRHLISQDTNTDLESRNKKERIAALQVRKRRLDLEIRLIAEHRISLAGSPDVHWDELRRREERGWRLRELADVRERLRKLERFSEVLSWLRSPFSAR